MSTNPPAELLLVDLGETVAANFFRFLDEWPRILMPPRPPAEMELDEQDPRNWPEGPRDPVDGMPREHP